MTKVKKISIYPFVKFQMLIGAMIGLIFGILYSFGGLIIDAGVTFGWFTSNETPGLSFGTVLAFGALIGMPLIFAGFGAILGVVESVLYNLYARKFGGMDIGIE